MGVKVGMRMRMLCQNMRMHRVSMGQMGMSVGVAMTRTTLENQWHWLIAADLDNQSALLPTGSSSGGGTSQLLGALGRPVGEDQRTLLVSVQWRLTVGQSHKQGEHKERLSGVNIKTDKLIKLFKKEGGICQQAFSQKSLIILQAHRIEQEAIEKNKNFLSPAKGAGGSCNRWTATKL